MKVSMKLTMVGLRRSLNEMVRSMAEDRDWRYAAAGEEAARTGTEAERETTRTDHDERGRN